MLDSFFNRVLRLQVCNFIKKRLQRRCFPVNIATFSKTIVLKNICERLLLNFSKKKKLFFLSSWENFEMFYSFSVRTRRRKKNFTNFRSSYRRTSVKKLFLKVSQYTQTPVLESLFLIKL